MGARSPPVRWPPMPRLVRRDRRRSATTVHRSRRLARQRSSALVDAGRDLDIDGARRRRRLDRRTRATVRQCDRSPRRLHRCRRHPMALGRRGAIAGSAAHRGRRLAPASLVASRASRRPDARRRTRRPPRRSASHRCPRRDASGTPSTARPWSTVRRARPATGTSGAHASDDRTSCARCAISGRSIASAVPVAVGHVVTTGRLASPAALRTAIDRHARRGRPGVPALRDALDDWVLDGKPVDSARSSRRCADCACDAPPARVTPIVAGLRCRLPDPHRRSERDRARVRQPTDHVGPTAPSSSRTGDRRCGLAALGYVDAAGSRTACWCSSDGRGKVAERIRRERRAMGAAPAGALIPPHPDEIRAQTARDWRGSRPDRHGEQATGGRGGRRRRRRASRRRGRRRRRRRCASPGAQASLDGVGGEHLVAAEGDGGLGDVLRPGTPRGDGAVQATTTSNSSARSASSIAVGSRSVPTTRIRRPSGWKSSKNTWAHVSAPGGLWAPSTIDERLVAEHLEAARHDDRGERPRSTTSGGQRGGEERLHRGQGDRRRCRPGGRRAAARRRRGRSSSACGCRRAGRRRASWLPAVSKSTPRSSRAAAGGSLSTATRSGSVSPMTAAERRLDDPRLLPGDVGQRRAGELVVVHADVGDDGDLGVDDVGGVPPPEQADLDDGDVDGDVGEPAERGRRARLEVASAARRSGPRGRRRRRSARRSSSSPIGSASRARRSLTRSRCGLVYVPTCRPWAISRRVIICAVEPLPLVR